MITECSYLVINTSSLAHRALTLSHRNLQLAYYGASLLQELQTALIHLCLTLYTTANLKTSLSIIKQGKNTILLFIYIYIYIYIQLVP